MTGSQEPLDLTETAPGEWSLVRRLYVAGRVRWQRAYEEAAARREAFFDSLAGPLRPPKPYRWWEGWMGLYRAAWIYVLFAAAMLIWIDFNK